jgi:hypothetical protein
MAQWQQLGKFFVFPPFSTKKASAVFVWQVMLFIFVLYGYLN